MKPVAEQLGKLRIHRWAWTLYASPIDRLNDAVRGRFNEIIAALFEETVRRPGRGL